MAGGINDGGQIVGYLRDQAGAAHGYLFVSGRFTTFDAPGAAATYADDVGADGRIVGTYDPQHVSEQELRETIYA